MPRNAPSKDDTTEENRRRPMGVSVHWLESGFLQEVFDGGYDRQSCIYDIEDLSSPQNGIIRSKGQNTTCPRDGRMGASYVDCLRGEDNVGPANVMLSYAWGNSVGDIVDSLVEYCETQKRDQKRTYVWLCCLCNNQHRVADDSRRGKVVPFEEFRDVFYEKVTGIGLVISIMSRWRNPVYLKRVWCVFELYTAFETEHCEFSIALPEREKIDMLDALNDGGDRGINLLYETLGRTKIESAEASEAADRDRILKIVEDGPGFEKLNNEVNRLLRDWVKNSMLEAVTSYEGQLGAASSENTDFAKLCSNVANILYKNGEHDQALGLYRKALGIWEGVPVKEHRATALCHYHIGMVLSEKGQYDAALEEFRKAAEIEAVILGKAHPDYARTISNIGFALRKKGDDDEALVQFRRALRIRENVLGEDHFETGKSLENIGETLRMMGRNDEALVHTRRASVIFEKALGNQHPQTAFLTNSIGLCLSAEGDHEEALAQLEQAMKIRENVLGVDHPDTAASYFSMGTALSNQGDVDQALIEYEKALSVRQSVLGKDHPDTVETKEKIRAARGA